MRYGYRGEGGHAAGPPSPATRWKKKGGIVSIDVTDQLTYLDCVALFDERLTWLTDVHGHRDLHNVRDRSHLSRTAGSVLVVTCIDTAQTPDV